MPPCLDLAPSGRAWTCGNNAVSFRGGCGGIDRFLFLPILMVASRQVRETWELNLCRDEQTLYY